MKYLLMCDSKDHFCGCSIWVRGWYDQDTNATELDDNDSAWMEACQHIQAGDYYIKDSEGVDEEV